MKKFKLIFYFEIISSFLNFEIRLLDLDIHFQCIFFIKKIFTFKSFVIF